MARAHGSYPWCREFKSPFRYEKARKSMIFGLFAVRPKDALQTCMLRSAQKGGSGKKNKAAAGRRIQLFPVEKCGKIV